MQTAQTIIKHYRRKRVIVCVTVAILTLILTLGARFISQRNVNQQRVLDFSSHTVRSLDNLLLSLEKRRSVFQQLVGQPCPQAHLALRKQAAILQTVRSIALIKDGILYCSSVFGSRNIPIRDFLPELPASTPKLILSTDRWLMKGSPILIQWNPVSQDGEDGVIEIINIDLITRMILEPERPLIDDVALSVGDRFLRYGQRVTDSLTFGKAGALVQLSSTHNPFSIIVSGPGPGELALKTLPAQLPLGLMLSLLLGYLAWLATANRMSFTWEIDMGIAAREFELFCQPLVNARTQACVGVEILLRWNNPRQGWISPEVFIPLAEEHNLIVPLTRYVLAETVRQIGYFPSSAGFHIGINVAASHFRHAVLLQDLNRLWFSANLRQQLVIELTERDALPDAEYRIVRELHRKGVKLAIDDFGTGNSSLSWLEKLHPDVLKIDQSFITAIGTDAVNSTVTDIIIALGQRLNIELVAEGVETEEQARYLRRHGVSVLQGFYYARPMPLRDFPQWLAGSAPPPAQHNGHIVPLMPLR
ncbi:MULTISPECIES: EAL domain-containing protein [Enterobacter]|uniref:EAL domain-containing protein n=1 Tax=Enterobacter TaxID=547 RepID=UPI00190AB8D3|nr:MULTISPECIES: cyclic diguanylate phosphodiesterase [Enterobacter]ELE9689685.1 EAL domain-containing protein [Enterobacter kobei]MBO4150663.1 EAL domain-containing protein [Enterobacter kobei]MCK7110129.1 EAL domain-containing protein [Enterobacter kobei]MCK7154511.1 EAL domain-containing protein [Enterobacter kobei]UOY64739.1 EAL domain-containing protein [Enterobacter kobei]